MVRQNFLYLPNILKPIHMRNLIFIMTLIFVSKNIYCQSYTVTSGSNSYVVTVGKHAKKFFKSYEDYLADTPIEGVKLIELKPSSLKYSDNGTDQKVKASKLTYNWFCNEDGILMRVFDGDIYYVVVDGPISFYIKRNEGTVVKPDKQDYNIGGELSDSYPKEYYSLTPNGPIEKLKESILEEYLDKYNLRKNYDTDPAYKREARDCVMCWQNKKTNNQIKYIKIINSKMK